MRLRQEVQALPRAVCVTARPHCHALAKAGHPVRRGAS
ncbi:hypothetical protein NK6_4336 [Bradyrhizobium diazoefficiens]|uniref:Uncharacterized protein n=1 Tax=Bradyrhizobium diazoefficiens TaxID=1355477 RepID=A0A0E4BQB0_9BRAD|nr:hypothetical protein NK6_4336 [Bradyrhizobium diazoefficiens]